MADTDLEYSALPTTDAIESGDEVLLVRDGVPIRFTGILPTENGVSDAVAEAEAARDAALAYGNATVKATWTEAAALTGLANGAIVLVVNTDTGTHASVTGDVGSVSGQTPNSGVFRYSTSLTALVRIAVLESAVAQAWAESATAPGAAGTKSAKSWVNFLLADTGFAEVAADMLLGATSNIVAVGTDLLLGAASKIAIVAADLALGASSAIRQAVSSATAAANSASAAASSAASISGKTDNINETTAALISSVVHGRPRSATLATVNALSAFTVVSANPVTHREFGGTYEGYNPSGVTKSVTLCRVAKSGNNFSQVGTETATLSLPAGYFSVTIPDSMIWQAGDLIGEVFAASAVSYAVVSGGADDGGWYGAATLPFTDSSVDLNNQIQRRLITKKVQDLPNDTIKVNLNNADRITWAGDSFGTSAYVLTDKAYLSLISTLTDWNVENLSRFSSTFIVDNNGTTSRGNAMRGVGDGSLAFGTQLYPAYRSTITVFPLGTNDATGPGLGVTPAIIKEEHGREIFELTMGLGSLVAFAAPQPANWGNGITNLYKQLSEQLGAYFINYRMYARRFGYQEFPGGNNAAWIGGHPGMRANKFYIRGSLEWMDTLGRPRMSVKVFRPRSTYVASLSGGVVGSVADLYYRGEPKNFYRSKKWKEISVGHNALNSDTARAKWDEVSSLTGLVQSPVLSEYLKLMANTAVAFTDYALVEMVCPHIAKHMTNAKFVMNDVGADIYVPNHLGGGAFANDTPVGAWTKITGTGGVFVIEDAVLRSAMRWDKLPILIVKSGAFNLTQSPELQYQTAGSEKRAGPVRDVRKHATGAQLLSNPSFPTSGSPTGWTTSGTVTPFAISGEVPPGLTGAVTIAAGASITSAAFTVTPSAYEDVEMEIRVLARRSIPTYASSNGYPGTSPVTADTFDMTRLKIGVTTPAGIVPTWDWIDMGWDECVARVLVPEGVTSMTVTISADDAIDVAEVRVAQFV